MTVKEIALAAATVLQADDIAELIGSAAADTEGADAAQSDADVKTLVKCVNLAVAELDRDFPITHAVRVSAKNGYIPYDVFDGTISIVRAVRSGGHAAKFSLSPHGIKVDVDGEYDVDYTLAPNDVGLFDEINVCVGVDSDVLCYLTARNYCLITGRSADASVWDQRYNAECEKRRISRRASLPRRAWI